MHFTQTAPKVLNHSSINSELQSLIQILCTLEVTEPRSVIHPQAESSGAVTVWNQAHYVLPKLNA